MVNQSDRERYGQDQQYDHRAGRPQMGSIMTRSRHSHDDKDASNRCQAKAT